MNRLFSLCLLVCVIVPLSFSAQKKTMQLYNIHTHKYDTFPAVSAYNIRTHQVDTYPLVSLHDIQYVSPESLQVADQLQTTVPSRWMCQVSSYYNDTVAIHAMVVTPCAADSPEYHGITYTQHGWTMLLHDSTLSNEWTGAIVRVDSTPDHTSPADTTRARNMGFDVPSEGDMITMIVHVNEFPVVSMNSMTQLAPVLDYAIVLTSIGSKDDPILHSHTPVTIEDFYYNGAYPSGKINYSGGEKYECTLVKFLSSPGNVLNVTTQVNTLRGTFNFVDGIGNSTSDYDVSHYFTLGNESNPTIVGDTSFHYPPVGAVIDSIRGAMFTSSGTENPRGYRIGPLWPGDLNVGISLPTVIGHRRFPVVVTDTDIVVIHDTVRYTSGGYPIYKGILMVSLNNGPWTADTMNMVSSDSVWEGKIQTVDQNPLAAGTQVRYFLKGIDDHGNEKILANPSTQLNADTAAGFFFYTVFNYLNVHMTIHDVQYTPYINAVSPYNGARVTVGGIVTASDSDIGQSVYRQQTGETGTTCWYIQSGNGPFSGISVYKLSTDTTHQLLDLVRGDSVLITGTVSEGGNITHINDTLVTVVSHGNPVPQPVTLSTASFAQGVGKGNPIAEPYEGMLVRFVNAKVSALHATFADSMEYSISDASNGPALIRQDGINTWSNTEADTNVGRTIFFQNDTFDTLVGEVFFGNGQYKICPRKNDDFVIGDTTAYPGGWNLLSVGRKQAPAANYATSYLFPGVTAYGYNGGYNIAAGMYPGSGYWIRMNGTQTFLQHGPVITRDTIPLLPGWNLIGAPGVAASLGSIQVIPAENHLSSFFAYNNGYVVVTSALYPRGGYWVKSDLAGSVVLSGSIATPKQGKSLNDQFNTITITDGEGNSQKLYFVEDPDSKIQLRDYEMPPMFPTENFVVKYESGRILETYPAAMATAKSFPIVLNASHGPLTISWEINTKEAKRYFLSDGMNGKVFKTFELKGTGTATRIQAATKSLMLVVNGGPDVPREFSLSQNYPNPFNPTTRVTIGLPQASHLQVGVYNILGQKVATLVDEAREAGYQVLEWNGTNDAGVQLSSGVYFLRMQADPSSTSAEGFTAVRKMMLMK